jgi:hypothetical protein
MQPKKINEKFNKKGLPISLKAGMIGLVRVQLNLMSLFTDAINLYVEDVHIIVGPNTKHVSKLEDYKTDANSFYDITDPFTNIVRMMKQVRLQEAEEKKLED